MWGWKENSAEQAQDKAELSQLAKEGKPLYGESDLPEYIQGVAHRNSMWSQLKFGVMPWFNFVKFVQLPRSPLPPFSSSPLRRPCADAHALRAATPSTVPTRPSTRSKLCRVEVATM